MLKRGKPKTKILVGLTRRLVGTQGLRLRAEVSRVFRTFVLG
jgi:hypothetical protein